MNKSYANILAKCNPIHPLVTLLLNPISRQRFGQNERSIFSFLNAGEPNGFLHFLQKMKFATCLISKVIPVSIALFHT